MIHFADHRHHLEIIIRAALRAADPAEAVRRHLTENDLDGARRVFIVGAGKGGAAMAHAAEKIVGRRLAGGVVAVPAASPGSTELAEVGSPSSRVRLVPAGHPKPDSGSLRAGEEIAALLERVAEDDLVLVVISGGGSALLERPVRGATLSELQMLTDGLLRSGAPIEEFNCVRKHLSQIKGGGLARMAAPARVLALILSDVIGDPLDVIASGPTVPDPTTLAEAQAILEKRGLGDSPLRSALAETPKRGDPIFAGVTNKLIGSNALARSAAAQAARELGFEAAEPAFTVQGEARECGAALARRAVAQAGSAARAAASIYGGESTVAVRGGGVGGRNQELVLAAAIALDGFDRPLVIASVGTDGVDGPTPAAGALATPQTAARARALGLDPSAMMADNDSHTFFSALGATIVTGPTGTNVNDLAIILTYPPES